MEINNSSCYNSKYSFDLNYSNLNKNPLIDFENQFGDCARCKIFVCSLFYRFIFPFVGQELAPFRMRFAYLAVARGS
jgi:hypothetical protein